MFPYTEEFPPVRREINIVSLPLRSGGYGKVGCLAYACWQTWVLQCLFMVVPVLLNKAAVWRAAGR